MGDEGDRGMNTTDLVGDERRGWFFWTSFVAGWIVIGFGVWSAFDHAGSVHPLRFGVWLVGLTLVHDLIVAPTLSAVAIWLVPRLPPRRRGVVLVATIVSGALALISLPALLGNPEGNPTILPRNYVAGLAVAIAATWIVAVIWIVAARARSERSP
jgi:hypothetical protein